MSDNISVPYQVRIGATEKRINVTNVAPDQTVNVLRDKVFEVESLSLKNLLVSQLDVYGPCAYASLDSLDVTGGCIDLTQRICGDGQYYVFTTPETQVQEVQEAADTIGDMALLTTTTKVEQNRVSASTLNTNPSSADHFAFPQGSSCYIPNIRLSLLQDNAMGRSHVCAPDILALRHEERWVHTFALAQLEEKATCRPVLDYVLGTVRSRFNSIGQRQMTIEHGETAQSILCNMNLVSPSSLPEGGGFCNGVPLIASEAKRSAASTLLCLPQACTYAGDMALYLKNIGLETKDCAVPTILCAGEYIQFAGAYLLEPAYPSFCLLSRPLDVTNPDDLRSLSNWVDALAEFCSRTYSLAKTKFASVCRGSCIRPEINLRNVFLKAIRPFHAEAMTRFSDRYSSHRTAGNIILESYRHLHKKLNDDVKESILFPLGVIQIPSNDDHIAAQFQKDVIARIRSTVPKANFKDVDTQPLTPLLVYEFLEDWQSGVPSLDDVKTDFIKKLNAIVTACSNVGVVFLDLRASNVMWKACGTDSCKIKLIDFEHVLPEGELIEADLARVHMGDKRYRTEHYEELVLNGTTYHKANVRTNQYWLDAITQYAEADCQDTTFDDFLLSGDFTESDERTD